MNRVRHRFTVSIRVVVLLTAVLPLVVLSWWTVVAVEEARAEESRAVTVRALSDEVVALVALESNLHVESFWAGAIGAVSSFGLPPAQLEEMLGLDLSGRYRAAQVRVDELAGVTSSLATAELSRLPAVFDGLRSRTETDTPSGRTIIAAYQAARTELKAAIARRLDTIEELTEGIGDRDALVASTRELSSTVALREQFTDAASDSFAARFPQQSLGTNPELELIVSWALYLDEVQRFRSDVSGGVTLIDEMRTEPVFARFTERVEGAVEAIVSPATADGQAGLDLNTELQAFEDSLVAIELHVLLVDAISSRVAVESEALLAGAVAEGNRVLLQAMVAALVALAMVLIGRRWIIRPLRTVADRAARMMDGELDTDTRPVGPREVREAHVALDGAARNLRLAEQQASALAAENLDAEVLSETAPGRIGAALQHALAQLRTSIEEREEYRRRLSHEAQHDGLTGLPNRSSIIAALERALARAGRTESRLAVLFIDLDRFKRINDQRGHEVGDRVLRTVARRILGAAREGDHVGRLGGDEFIVVAEPVDDIETAVDIAHRIRNRVMEPIRLEALTLRVGVSVGVAVSTPDEVDADLMFRDADLAVYRAKEGAGGVEVCDDELRLQLAHRYDIETRLAAALSHDDLDLHFQPIVAADDHRVVSLEALIRWPTDPVVNPSEFIPIAERSDLIIDVDRWVLRRAIGQLAAWTGDPIWGAVPVAVNISARHVSSASLAETVDAMLRVHGVSGDRLIIEITESAILDDLERAIETLTRVRAAGVRVAIDDFGTGYTSLSHLRELPIDILKLDREFVASNTVDSDRTLAKLIVEAGHLLDVTVTAEGVETEDQALTMRRIGADRLQGFWFGAAVPAPQLEPVYRADRAVVS